MVDMIFTLHQLQEKAIKQHQGLYVVFVDSTKAFESVDRPILWELLKHLNGSSDVFRKIFQEFQGGTTGSIVIGMSHPTLSTFLTVHTGTCCSTCSWLLFSHWCLNRLKLEYTPEPELTRNSSACLDSVLTQRLKSSVCTNCSMLIMQP